MANPEKNYIKGTVAYSYPEHSKENGLGDSGSMDSPFDYVKKLMYQEKQLNKWFATNTATERNAQETPLGTDHWSQTKAPLNSWYMYEKTSTTDTSGKMFLPSYGLMLYNSGYSQKTIVNGDIRVESTVVSDYLGASSYTYVNSKNETVTVNRRAGKDTIIEAGTDCVGFANRSASYIGNKYKWADTPKGWTEYNSLSGTNDISLVLNSYEIGFDSNGDMSKNKGVRSYPSSYADNSTWYYSYNIMTTIEDNNYDSNAKVTLSTTVKKSKSGATKDKLMRIVPGDIFVKCSDSTTKTDDVMNSHIAIVAYVPANAAEMTVEELLNSIVLIEAEFSWRVQSVIKSFTLGDYLNTEGLPVSKYFELYSNADCTDWESPNLYFEQNTWKLNNKHFAIRRLICN